MNIRTVVGWRTRLNDQKAQKHSEQFAKARMPGKQAAKLHKGKKHEPANA